MTTGASLPISLLYREETLRPYFPANTDAHMRQFKRSIDAANEFLRAHPPESLARGGHKIKGLARALQYFKDETFLTLYAFVSLDMGGSAAQIAERERLFTELLRVALPHLKLEVTRPVVELEKQVTPSADYLGGLAQRFAAEPDACHPVWYLRVLGSENKSLEGSTHSDAILRFAGDRRVMVEAKFLSDISTSTKYASHRDQISRNLDAGLAQAGYDLDRFAYVFITPRSFRDRPQSRFYGYKLTEYMDLGTGPDALRRDLPHLGSPERRVDFAELSRRIGWVTWEEICEVVTGSPAFRAPEFPREGFEQFFRERCLWPDGASRHPRGAGQ